MSWQDISTAPLDKPILGSDGECIMVVIGHKYPNYKEPFWRIENSFGFNEDGSCYPTHWQPLPLLPNGEEYAH